MIQEQQFTPMGGTDSVKVDVRLLSATHRALRAEVERGSFRADLMYRLRVIPLYLRVKRKRRRYFIINSLFNSDIESTLTISYPTRSEGVGS